MYIACFSEAGIQDRVIIQELLKTVAQTNQLDTSTQKDFKGMSSFYLCTTPIMLSFKIDMKLMTVTVVHFEKNLRCFI